jgi:hypothetical protein
MVEVADEGAVDLQPVHRQAAQQVERGVTGAEVVDGDVKAIAGQMAHGFGSGHRVAQQGRFCDFQLHGIGAELVLGQGLVQLLGQVAIEGFEQAGGDVDPQPGHPQLLQAPLPDLLKAGLQHPVGEWKDQAALFRQRDEERRGHFLAVVVAPAQQHLAAAELAGAVALGLHQDAQLLAGDGLVQGPIQHQPFADLATEGGGVGPQLASPLVFGLHQGSVGALEQAEG